MNKIGVHALTFVGDIRSQSIELCAKKASSIGYDVIEIPLLNPDALDINSTIQSTEKYKLEATVSLGLSYETDISSEDTARVNAGKLLLDKALEKTIDIGSKNLCGVIHSALQKNNNPKTLKGYENSLRTIRNLGEKASQNDVTISLEVVNRYETNIINTAEDALHYLEDLNMKNVKIHMDSYHMNIEENNFFDPIKNLGKKNLGMYHVGENHRGYLGSGNINFTEAFSGLKEIDYEGIITFESFSSVVVDPVLSNTLAIWRNLWENSDDLATNAIDFIRKKLQ